MSIKFSFVALTLALVLPQVASAEVVSIAFPVQGPVSFSDTYLADRGDHLHHATDILAEKMTPVLAAVDGRITFAPMVEPSYGYIINLMGDDHREYTYVHLNNDTPGTDDGAGGPEYAYASGIEAGERVEQGEVIGYVGDSGNAEFTVPHLHFEMYDENGDVMNPYESLIAAYSALSFDPELEQDLATTINVDQNIPPAEGEVNCESDTLIRTPEVDTVYYCGQDGGRYVFHNESTYFSWYDDFDDVEYVSAEVMASVPLNGVVTYKPGVYMIKILSSPKIYAVTRDGALRWVPTPEIAESLYGEDWPEYVRDIPDGFFGAYQIGEPVTTGS